jgi:aryl-alcohol dehydrogenase-like predicted oxidoreductase
MTDSANTLAAPDDLSIDTFTRYRKALAREVSRLVKPYDVEDIIQETYLRLFQAAKQRPIRSPRAFMIKTIRNLALNKLRWADALNHVSTVVIATKGGQTHDVPGVPNAFDARPEQLRAACEGSLKRLRLEQIPLYYLHSPDPKIPYQDSIGELARLQKEGKIRHIGVANIDQALLTKAQSEAKIVAVQNTFNIVSRKSDDVLAMCVRQHIVFIPNTPLGMRSGRTLDAADSRVAALQMLADKRHISLPQAVLAWELAFSPIILPIPGTTQLAHLEEDVASAKVHFSTQEMRAVG